MKFHLILNAAQMQNGDAPKAKGGVFYHWSMKNPAVLQLF